ncbi:hypothetical protein CLV68_1206 [Actinokineospora cianjurensis]|uniref:Uncharacterized protein n=1 Tax=Actinokineospora cianjurensis TaxID=585224 RepID=A0A421B8I4_9PSEU|nr:hypothetical protein CLV68_1206 [Actinokineospora cianjurensis]
MGGWRVVRPGATGVYRDPGPAQPLFRVTPERTGVWYAGHESPASWAVGESQGQVHLGQTGTLALRMSCVGSAACEYLELLDARRQQVSTRVVTQEMSANRASDHISRPEQRLFGAGHMRDPESGPLGKIEARPYDGLHVTLVQHRRSALHEQLGNTLSVQFCDKSLQALGTSPLVPLAGDRRADDNEVESAQVMNCGCGPESLATIHLVPVQLLCVPGAPKSHQPVSRFVKTACFEQGSRENVEATLISLKEGLVGEGLGGGEHRVRLGTRQLLTRSRHTGQALGVRRVAAVMMRS